MIPVTIFKNKKIALFGLGGSGLATAQALALGGAQVVAFDENPQACERACAAGIVVQDLRKITWQEIASLILTPGVALTHPHPHWVAKCAQMANVEIIGDIELFMRQRAATMAELKLQERDCPLIAITGTNGKSTTTALIAHILHQTGHDVAMGGNIGKPILELDPVRKGLFYVIECSSYQIDLSPSLRPTVGILLNLSPDHIDRHGTFENYAAVKKRLVAGAEIALVGLDDAPCRSIAQTLKKTTTKLVGFSSQWQEDSEWFGKGGELYQQKQSQMHRITSLKGIVSLRGQHNAQNACAALAACACLGLDIAQASATLTSFQSLPHRMEEVGRCEHVLFINDSKATNAEACAPALSSFDAIYWIAGGQAKQGGIEELKPFFHKIRHAYLIGEAAEDFCQTIGTTIPVTLSGTLAHAVSLAAQNALVDKNGEEVAVLFSPACASFDQFANYAARGEAFRHLVNAILMDQSVCSGKS